MLKVEVFLPQECQAAEKKGLTDALSAAVRFALPDLSEQVDVIIRDNRASERWRHEQIVRGFLAAMEAREVAKARTMLSPDFTMRFPGAEPMYRLEDLIAWAKPRYRFVSKTYEGFDCATTEDKSVVYCFGALSGEWPDGIPFHGIRFIDRFELRDDLITRQDVWNDIAETRINA